MASQIPILPVSCTSDVHLSQNGFLRSQSPRQRKLRWYDSKWVMVALSTILGSIPVLLAIALKEIGLTIFCIIGLLLCDILTYRMSRGANHGKKETRSQA